MAHQQNFICIEYQHFRDMTCNILGENVNSNTIGILIIKYLFLISAKLKCSKFST